MKSSIKFLFFVLITGFFLSCGGPIESLNFDSPDGDRSISITGKRESPAGPIIARVTLKTPGLSDSFSFEHQAGSMTKDNVSAEWKNNMHCMLTFKLDDGDAWECECFLMDDKLKAVKVFKVGHGIFD